MYKKHYYDRHNNYAMRSKIIMTRIVFIRAFFVLYKKPPTFSRRGLVVVRHKANCFTQNVSHYRIFIKNSKALSIHFSKHSAF